MLNLRIDENEKKVYVDVNGYITSVEIQTFINEYKHKLKPLKTSQYRLIIMPSIFEYEN